VATTAPDFKDCKLGQIVYPSLSRQPEQHPLSLLRHEQLPGAKQRVTRDGVARNSILVHSLDALQFVPSHGIDCRISSKMSKRVAGSRILAIMARIMQLKGPRDDDDMGRHPAAVELLTEVSRFLCSPAEIS
jgi:hypothetical protein